MSGAIIISCSIYFFESSNFFKYLDDTEARYKLSMWFGSSLRIISKSPSASLNLFSLTACLASLRSTESEASSELNSFVFICNYFNKNKKGA